MALQLAIGSGGDVDLWCVDRGFTPEGGQKFWVINGHWAGVYYRGQVYIHDFDHDGPFNPLRRNSRGSKWDGKLLWRGRTPFHDEDYNEAMWWLRDYLKRQPELKPFFERMEYGMATKEKIKFSDAVQTIDAERHNERVLALATAHAETMTAITNMEKNLASMREYLAEIAEKGEVVETLTDDEFSKLFNRQFGYLIK